MKKMKKEKQKKRIHWKKQKMLKTHECFSPLTLSTTALTVYLITNVSDNLTTDNITLPF